MTLFLREKVIEPNFRYPHFDGRLALAKLLALQGRLDGLWLTDVSFEGRMGAGVLDIYRALDATGYTDQAPSPRVVRSAAGEVLLVEVIAACGVAAEYCWPVLP